MERIGMQRIREIMENPENIRNIALVGSEGHGRYTLLQELINRAGIKPPVPQRWYYEDRREEPVYQDVYFDAIDNSNTAHTLYYSAKADEPQGEEQKRQCLISLISLSSSDQTSEIASTFRITDGALLVIDAAKDFSTQFQRLLRQSIQERVKHSLIINKIDAAILDLKSNGEQLYHRFSQIISKSNSIIEHLSTVNKGQIAIDPVENVVFGSAKGGWAFTISTFAHLYAKRFSIDIGKMKEKLWGDNFFDNRKKKWQSAGMAEDGRPLRRSFVEFIMEPICKLCESLFKGQEEQYLRTLHALNIELSEQQKTAKGRKLVDLVMKKWLPLADCVLKMMIVNLPSPMAAQKYKTDFLYSGPNDDQIFRGMKMCNPAGPLIMFISKMIPSKRQNSRFYAFGRIFSGTVKRGDKIKIMGPRFKPERNDDLFERRVQRIYFLEGHKLNPLENVPCGNLIALDGIDLNIIKYGSITDGDNPRPHPIRIIKEKMVPIMKMIISPKQPQRLPWLIEGIKKLSKMSSGVIYQLQETGQNTIASSSEQRLERCFNALHNDYAKYQIVKSEPIVIYKQTITKASEKIVKAISANKHNRLFGTGELLDEGYIDEVEDEIYQGNQKTENRKELLCQKYNWDLQTAEKIWFFGPDEFGSNIFANFVAQGAKNSKQIRESVCAAFQWSSKMGVLCQEYMRGIKFNLVDCQLHTDAIHRGGGQIIPTARRLLFGIELLCQPTLIEPIYEYNISTTQFFLGSVYQAIDERRGIINEVITVPTVGNTKQGITHFHQIKAYISAQQSIGFSNLLRENTKGNVFQSHLFDHWQPIQGLPFVNDNATQLVMSIRKRKGLKEEKPLFETYAEIMQ